MEEFKEIIVPEGTVKTLQGLAQQIQVLQGYIRVIGDTLLSVHNRQGGYQFNHDFTQLISADPHTQ